MIGSLNGLYAESIAGWFALTFIPWRRTLADWLLVRVGSSGPGWRPRRRCFGRSPRELARERLRDERRRTSKRILFFLCCKKLSREALCCLCSRQARARY